MAIAPFSVGSSSGTLRTKYDSLNAFKEFHISKSGLSNFELVGRGQETAAYHIETSLYKPSKRDITLHAGTNAKGVVLGDVDLRTFGGHYSVELGDMQHEPVTLEELDRVKGWNSRHKFHFVFGGEERRRQAYMWRHPGTKLLANRDDLELVTVNEDMDSENEEERDEVEVVLAQYLKDGGGGGWKKKGALIIRDGGGRDWELMVVLTLMALVVSRRREQ